MVIGYIFTAAYAILLAGAAVSALLASRRICRAMSGNASMLSVAAAILIACFFIAFSLLYVHPVEQLYFDENIYQGIALNILHSGNALWCQFGTAQLKYCGLSQIYHDPVEISFYLAIAFALFGSGVATAYGMELAVGAVSILLVFLLSSSMFGKKAGVASALIFSTIPELFIWSRTQAIPDLTLMMFSILAFFAYDVYRKERSAGTFAFFAFALGIAVYMRIEAMLLVPIFVVLELLSARPHGPGWLSSWLKGSADLRKLAIAAAFVVLVLPQAYYIIYEYQNPSYGNGTICNMQSNSTFSVGNFECNTTPNVQFFAGAYDSVSDYPAYFSPLTTIIALIGAALLLFDGRRKGRMPLLMLCLWIFAFHLFYDFFYAGSVLFGVDVRFMLVVYPPIAILGGFGIASISDSVMLASKRRKGRRGKRSALSAASMIVYAALLAAFAAFPFYNAIPITTISPSSMPQESMPMAATSFIYQDAGSVPSNCLVFSFTPDIWYEMNRSSAQVGYFNSGGQQFAGFESNFSCFVFDSGYWCTADGGAYQSSTCRPDLSAYNTSAIAAQSAPNGVDNFTLYYIKGYNAT